MSKKVLIIYFNNITPTDSGSKKLTLSHIKHLQENNFDITLFCSIQEASNSAEIKKYVNRLIEFDNPLNNKGLKIYNKLSNIGKANPFDQHKVFRQKLSKALNPLYDSHDYIIFHYVNFAEVLPQKVLDKSFIFTHDLMFYRLNDFENKDGNKDQFIKQVKDREVKVIDRFKKVLVVADYEKKILVDEGIQEDKILDVGAPQDTVDIDSSDFQYYFGFIGGYYSQNIEAVKLFLEKYYPSFSDKKFAIAGSVGDSTEIQKIVSKYPNVSLLGFVEDLKVFYSSVRFLTASLPVGSGIKIKVLEAMAHGKIVLGTEKAFEGIYPQNLKEAIDLREYDSIDSLKSQLEELEDNEKYTIVSDGAKQLIKDKFGFEKLFRPLTDYMIQN